MIINFEKADTRCYELGDVAVLKSGTCMMIIQGDYSDEYMLLNLTDYSTTDSEEDFTDLFDGYEVETVIKHNKITMGVIV